ncbi:MAG: VacJ family lipoprotein [Neomegalonema sp.]|nr:VacJ family lipoprotein [Neomegalonema sp.]
MTSMPREWGQTLIRLTAALVLAFGMAGCATQQSANGIYDPYESFNRSMHEFNKGVDTAVLRPVSKAYDFAMPDLFRFLINNGLNHLALPVDFANHLLSADIEEAGETLARFGLNTVMGAGGLLDPASDLGIARKPSDFGKTLAYWGVGEGPYFELPLLGPTTTRDGFGRLGDMAFSPTTYISGPVGPYVGPGVLTTRIVETRASNSDAIDSVLYESGDSYATARSVYLQMRRAAVNGGQADAEEAPDIFAE